MTNLFIVPLQAQPAAAAGGNYTMLIMMVAIFAVMYFLMIRPQQKKQKEIVKWRNALQKGDKVLTAGGIYGKIKSVEDNVLTIEVAHEVEIRVDKNMVMRDPSDVLGK